MKKWVKITIPIVLCIIAAIAVAYFIISNRTIPNKENVTGNTCGNLNNGGLFCEYDDKIYFANPNDENKLYVMDSDCSNAKKLNDDSVASINVCSNYIFYVKNNFSEDTIGMIFKGQLFGVYRCNLNGEKKKALYDELSGTIALCGNNLYYQHYDDKTALSFYKVGIDGKNNTKISDSTLNPACIQRGKIYYADQGGRHNIMMYDTETDKTSTFINCNAYMADVEDNYTYYIDLDKGYSLVRQNNKSRTLELLYEGNKDTKVVTFNVYGNKVFFQVEGDNKGLYRMNIDGSQLEKIASGDITNIHCTSKYTFFQYCSNQGVLYRVSTAGNNAAVEEITVKK